MWWVVRETREGERWGLGTGWPGWGAGRGDEGAQKVRVLVLPPSPASSSTTSEKPQLSSTAHPGRGAVTGSRGECWLSTPKRRHLISRVPYQVS